jgi:hypothetical protein
MTVVHYKKIKGKEYAYDIISYRDKETKKVKKKSIYLGRVIDRENKVFKRMRTGGSKETCMRINCGANNGNPDIDVNIDDNSSNSSNSSNNLILDYGVTYFTDKIFRKSNLCSVFSSVFKDTFQ